MDRSLELPMDEADGWRLGVYEDIQLTFRAPVVNWVWRSLMANYPAFTRYAWGQVKPIFQTRAFVEYAMSFRDAVLTPLEEQEVLPAYTASSVGLSEQSFVDVRRQLATFDTVAPRLGALFVVFDRALGGELLGRHLSRGESSTTPAEARDGDHTLAAPSMVSPSVIPTELDETMVSIRTFHGLSKVTPSIYRCLAQWPKLLERIWTDLAPTFASVAFERSIEAMTELIDETVDLLAYTPRLAPEDLVAIGMSTADVEAVQDHFTGFVSGPIATVVPALPVYASVVGAGGPRRGDDG